MKSVMLSIQPYWVFLIIAKKMGWNIDKVKTIEARKSFPKAEDWNRKAEIYCSKDKKSFNLIPKEYQPLMAKFLGKVIGEFTCDRIYEIPYVKPFYFYGRRIYHSNTRCKEACLDWLDLEEYLGDKDGYGWHISDLKVYDKPRELSEFYTRCNIPEDKCKLCDNCYSREDCYGREYAVKKLTRAPQSWGYVEL